MRDNNSMAANLVAKRGNRATASILGFMEDVIYTEVPQISTQLQRRIRQVIMDNINEFKDLAIDIVKSETSIINEEYLARIDAVHEDLRSVKESVNGIQSS